MRKLDRAHLAVGRHFGPSPEARERIAAAEAEALWRARCPKCGSQLRGSMAELKAHRCQEASSGK